MKFSITDLFSKCDKLYSIFVNVLNDGLIIFPNFSEYEQGPGTKNDTSTDIFREYGYQEMLG